jgi:hypothetical protein
MSKAALAFAVLVTLIASAAFAEGSPEPVYAELVARAESGDATLNYSNLRLSYSRSASYDPDGKQTAALFSAAWNAFQARDCRTALDRSAELLKINYVSIPMHFVRSDCLKQAGDQPGSDRELAIGRGLANSLLTSGDGKSTATAYVVVTLSEEGFVLTALGIRAEKQALLMADDGPYDLISGSDEKTGEPCSTYFRAGAIMSGVMQNLARPPEK